MTALSRSFGRIKKSSLYLPTPQHLFILVPLTFSWHPFVAFIDLITPKTRSSTNEPGIQRDLKSQFLQKAIRDEELRFTLHTKVEKAKENLLYRRPPKTLALPDDLMSAKFAKITLVQLSWFYASSFLYPLVRGIFRTRSISLNVLANSVGVSLVCSSIATFDFVRWAFKAKEKRKKWIPSTKTDELKTIFAGNPKTLLQKLTSLTIQFAVPSSVCLLALYKPILPFIFFPLCLWKGARHLYQLMEDVLKEWKYEHIKNIEGKLLALNVLGKQSAEKTETIFAQRKQYEIDKNREQESRQK